MGISQNLELQHTENSEIKKNEIIDMGLIIFFPSPNSFTGEAVVEFHSHGGPLLGELLIDEIVGLGARRAEPGEFF